MEEHCALDSNSADVLKFAAATAENKKCLSLRKDTGSVLLEKSRPGTAHGPQKGKLQRQESTKQTSDEKKAPEIVRF